MDEYCTRLSLCVTYNRNRLSTCAFVCISTVSHTLLYTFTFFIFFFVVWIYIFFMMDYISIFHQRTIYKLLIVASQSLDSFHHQNVPFDLKHV